MLRFCPLPCRRNPRLAFGVCRRLAALTTDTGGLPEIIDATGKGGTLVAYTGDEETDTKAYTDVIIKWAADRPLVARLAAEAHSVAMSFDLEAKLDMWVTEFENADIPLPPPLTDAAGHMAVVNALREYEPYVSLNKIEVDRRVPPRPEGPELELQLHCGESSAHLTNWIDGFAYPKGCAEDYAPSAEALHTSAFHQCGSWCIYDLTKKEKVGWEFAGLCFMPFGNGRKSPCDDGTRPSLNLG